MEDEGPEEVLASSEQVRLLRELHERTLETSSRKKRRRRRAAFEDDDRELPAEAVSGLDPKEPPEATEAAEEAVEYESPSQPANESVTRTM